MKITEKVKLTLSDFNIRREDGLCYLISLYFEQEASYIPESLKARIMETGIVEEVNGELKWNTPLFESQDTEKDWIMKEYMPLFESYGTSNRHKREVKTRITRLLRDHPEYSKDDVVKATSLYIKSCIAQNKDALYVKLPHNFICSGMGITKNEPILTWLEISRESKVKSHVRSDAI